MTPTLALVIPITHVISQGVNAGRVESLDVVGPAIFNVAAVGTNATCKAANAVKQTAGTEAITPTPTPFPIH
jgi:hypothetical protein